MPGFSALLLVMALSSFACRFGGYLAMRFLPPSPRLDAALRATPLAVMSAITALALAAGGLTEWLSLGAAIALTLALRNDIFAALAAVALAAGLRWAGM
jgi:uncharacterized membrane protein